VHELALAQAIAEGVLAQAAACGATRVASVRLRIGEAAGVVPDALRSCFEMVASAEPPLCGAQLAIEMVPHRARCGRCGEEFAVVDYIVRCPACHGWDAAVISGTELEVREMEIETADEA
jgi:hydrogenase nickel incorporation protein HypA/HybF